MKMGLYIENNLLVYGKWQNKKKIKKMIICYICDKSKSKNGMQDYHLPEFKLKFE